MDAIVVAMATLLSDPDVEMSDPEDLDMPKQIEIRRIKMKAEAIRWRVFTEIVIANCLSVAPGSSPLSRPCPRPLDEPSVLPSSVVESVDHGGEAAAQRDPQILQEHANHDWADNVAKLIQGDTCASSDPRSDDQVF